MGKTYQSAALEAVHEVALGLAEAGTMDKRSLRGFDALCLTPVEPLSPEEIRALRLREKAS
jgi:putative transcriptional regulator